MLYYKKIPFQKSAQKLALYCSLEKAFYMFIHKVGLGISTIIHAPVTNKNFDPKVAANSNVMKTRIKILLIKILDSNWIIL